MKYKSIFSIIISSVLLFNTNIYAQTILKGYEYGDASSPTGKEWESPQSLGYNKEQPHAIFFPFQNINTAKEILPYNSKWYHSLNGTWDFKWVANPNERPEGFYKEDFSTKAWDKIKVPSSWNIEGLKKDGTKQYGTPIYVNQPVIFMHKVAVDDWKGGVMRTPPSNWTTYTARNEVGSYKREFTINDTWKNRETFINFDGVDSFFYLWINGQYVGFSKNSRNTAIFNITKYLKKGKNTVAVEVYRNSDASFLEAQDMFRLPGIFRDVYLTSCPKVTFADINIIPNLKNNNNIGELNIKTFVKNYLDTKAEGYTIKYSLFLNKLYTTKSSNKPISTQYSIPIVIDKEWETISETTITLNNPKLWSAEEPNCYTLIAQLKNKYGITTEIISSLIGFREVEIKDTPAQNDEFGIEGRYYYINGKPVKLKGVNRHEHDPLTGHYVSNAQMFNDVMLFKKANINHVRNSHYPEPFYWYYLCDLYGIYQEDEANIESHEYHYGDASLSHPIEWKNAHIARVMEMVKANINHPSIVIWSLGNEAGPGKNFKYAYDALKNFDNSIPVQYERNNDIVDMGSNQYPSIAWVNEAVKGKSKIKYPFHISEYAHSMGNACGNLADYWKAIESTNFFCGGAIWDWADQALYNYTKDGEQYLAYGGDFGDTPNDGQFVMNGIVFADRTPKPQYYEVKKVYQNVEVSSSNPISGNFTIFNKNYFVSLGSYILKWELIKNGQIVKQGVIDGLNEIKPRTKKDIHINFGSLDNNAEYYLNLKFNTTEDLPWAEEGYTQYDEQFLLQKNNNTPKITNAITTKDSIQIVNNQDFTTITGNDFEVKFNNTTGNIYALSYNAQKVLIDGQGPKLCAFRAFTNNDNWFYEQWFKNGLHNLQFQVVETPQVNKNPNGTVSLKYVAKVQAPNGAKILGGTASGKNTIEEFTKPFDDFDFMFYANQVWTVYPDGSLELAVAITSNKPNTILPRLGYVMELPYEYKNFTYYGRGPIANYNDRKTSQYIGIYKTMVDKEFVNFPKPQEMNNHEDVRWCALTNKTGTGLAFIADSSFSASVNKYSDLDLTIAGHIKDLPQSKGIFLHIDKAVTGLGGNSCGQGGPLTQDRVKALPTNFRFIIRPVKGNVLSLTNVAPVTNYPTPINIAQKADNCVKVVFASSEENGEGDANHLVDKDPSTYWHTMYSVTLAKYPHWVDFDCQQPSIIKGFIYTPRQDSTNGHIKDYEIYISQDGKNWGEPIYKGSFAKGTDDARIMFKEPIKARYLRFKALNEQRGNDYATAAEFTIIKN